MTFQNHWQLFTSHHSDTDIDEEITDAINELIKKVEK